MPKRNLVQVVLLIVLFSSMINTTLFAELPSNPTKVPSKDKSFWGIVQKKIKHFCFSDGMCNQKIGEICFNFDCVPQCTDSDGPPTNNTSDGILVPGKITFYVHAYRTPGSKYVKNTMHDMCNYIPSETQPGMVEVDPEHLTERHCRWDSGKLSGGWFPKIKCPEGTICQEKEEPSPNGNGNVFKIGYCGTPPPPPTPFAGFCQEQQEQKEKGLLEDFVPCTVDACDSTTGNITHDPVVCEDKQGCHPQTGECVSFICVNTPLDDLDACTSDSCDPLTGAVTHQPMSTDSAGLPCGKATSLMDTDGDGLSDTEDNCPSVANKDQFDSDQDGIGESCECPGNKEMSGQATNWNLSGLSVSDLALSNGRLLAATNQGVYAYDGANQENMGPAGMHTVSLYDYGKYLYAGTTDGVYRMDNSKSWSKADAGYPLYPPTWIMAVNSFLSYQGYLYATSGATLGKVFRFDEPKSFLARQI